MNCILNEDETSIESISEGDFVIIIENIYYLDDTYLNLLTDKNYIGEKINVHISFSGRLHERNLVIPRNIKYSQLYKALILNFGCRCTFICSGKLVNQRNDEPIQDNRQIVCSDSRDTSAGFFRIFGKIIKLKIKTGFPDSYGNEILYQEVGVLSSVKRFLEHIKNKINCQTIKGFYFDKKEIY